MSPKREKKSPIVSTGRQKNLGGGDVAASSSAGKKEIRVRRGGRGEEEEIRTEEGMLVREKKDENNVRKRGECVLFIWEKRVGVPEIENAPINKKKRKGNQASIGK